MTEARLQQVLAKAGVASRRRAEGLITEGRVAVNGKVVTTLGVKADPDRDEITVDGKRVGPEQEAATVMLHKPVQVVTTLDDPQGRETVAELVEGEPYRFVPVGRLDYQTEGLLFLSTDGDLIHRLLHPSHFVPKVYNVKVKGRLKKQALDALREGVKLDDGPTRPTVVEVLEEGDSFAWLEIVVTEGRNRLIRRMVEAVGHPALRLVRTEMATLELGTLKPGQYRYLRPAELALMYATAGLPSPRTSARYTEVEDKVLGKARRGRGARPEGRVEGAAAKKKDRPNRGGSRRSGKPTSRGKGGRSAPPRGSGRRPR